MKVKKGIVLYDIEMNACLNGVYTNENAGSAGGEIFNEIARLKKTPPDWPTNLAGTYDCFYFDLGNDRCDGILEITVMRGGYDVKWFDLSRNLLFEGTGYKMNSHQLAVRYQSA